MGHLPCEYLRIEWYFPARVELITVEIGFRQHCTQQLSEGKGK